jgi:hypothetical protein
MQQVEKLNNNTMCRLKTPDTGAQRISVCTQLIFAQRKIIHTLGTRLRSRFLSVGY